MNTQTRRDFILALLVATSACSDKKQGVGDGGDAGQRSAQAAASGQDVPRVSNARIEDLGKLMDLVVAEANELPRAEFDPAALVAAIGGDPQKLFEWVRDKTYWAPYRGLLRGAQGVMLDRVGSNLDRAVLLGELLRRAGHSVRLAHSQLPEGRARDLLTKVRPIPSARYVAPPPRQLPVEQRRQAETIFPDLEQRIHKQSAESERLLEEGRGLVRSQADWLITAVVDRSDKAARAADDRQALVAMRDYWWIERNADGKWIPMDTTLPEAIIGSVPMAAKNVAEWTANDRSPTLSAENWHAVQLRVMVERYDDGTITENLAFETTLRPAEIIGQPIYLVHVPKPWPDMLADPKTDPTALGNAAVGVKDWLPTLRVGDQYMSQSGFTESGDLKTNPLSTQSHISSAAGGSLFGGFEDALSGGAAGETSHVTAEWLDYEIRVPGQPTQRIRRPIFDLLGPVSRARKVKGFDATTNELLVRRYEALLSRIDILVQPCELSAEFVASFLIAGFIKNQEEIRKLGRERDRVKARALARRLLDRLNVWGALPTLVLWRSTLGGISPGWFIDRPNILNYRYSRTVVNADQLPYRESIDIVSNSTGVAMYDRGNSFDTRLRQGVADTVAELITLGGSSHEVENTARLFSKMGNASDRSIIIAARDVGAVRTLAWPDDVSARLTDDVLTGFVAVATRESVELNGRPRLGWWRVDPMSGQTLGVMDTGFHDALAEKPLTDQAANNLTYGGFLNVPWYAAGNQHAALWLGVMFALVMLASAI